jgi:hypothetical protein
VPNRLELDLEFGDLAHDPPPINLELGLARPTRADATGLLGKGLPATAKAGQAVAQECELDLCATLLRSGVLGEDVEDYSGPVDSRPAENLLEISLLSRRELVVEDHGIGVDELAEIMELAGLATADVGRRIKLGTVLDNPGSLVRARGVDEEVELVETLAHLGLGVGVRDDADEHDSFPETPLD